MNAEIKNNVRSLETIAKISLKTDSYRLNQMLSKFIERSSIFACANLRFIFFFLSFTPTKNYNKFQMRIWLWMSAFTRAGHAEDEPLEVNICYLIVEVDKRYDGKANEDTSEAEAVELTSIWLEELEEKQHVELKEDSGEEEEEEYLTNLYHLLFIISMKSFDSCFVFYSKRSNVYCDVLGRTYSIQLISISTSFSFSLFPFFIYILKCVRGRIFRQTCDNKIMRDNICNSNNTSRPSLVLGSWAHKPTYPKCYMNHNACGSWPCGPHDLLLRLSVSNGKKIHFDNKIKLLYFKLLALTLIANLSHITALIKLKLAYDIEPNPGPPNLVNSNELTVITLNCRGLGNINKFRALLNTSYNLLARKRNTIILLQETMIKDSKYLDLAWRGIYALTPGTGNSQGCVTLLNANTKIVNQIDVGNRAHVLEVEGLDGVDTKLVVANIYAPIGYGLDKRTFFTEIIDIISTYNLNNIILGGDFNLTFGEEDRINRRTSNAEIITAGLLKAELSEINLKDAWEGFQGMTWNRGDSFTRLDRLFYKINGLRHLSTEVDWGLSDSDHAAVKVNFGPLLNRKKGVKICRLNPKVVQDPDMLLQLRSHLIEQLNSIPPTFNPHVKLEFAKMSIRSKALELGKRIVSG
jgi:hypothetical protein